MRTVLDACVVGCLVVLAPTGAQQVTRLGPPLTGNRDVMLHGVSPDGRYALLTADVVEDETWDLYSVDLETLETVQLSLGHEEIPGFEGPAAFFGFEVDPTSGRVLSSTYRSAPFPIVLLTRLELAVPGIGPGVRYTGGNSQWFGSSHLLVGSDGPFGSSRLYKCSTEAHAITQVTFPDQVWLGKASLTPDETHVLYTQFDDGVGLFSRPLDLGSEPVLLSAGSNPEGFIFSHQSVPDGSAVVFVGEVETPGVAELWRASIEGGSPPARLDDPYSGDHDVDRYFRISPDGTWVVYRADRDTDEVFELYSVPTAGGAPVRLSGDMVAGGDVLDPVVSNPDEAHFWITPDGSRVLYLADQDVDGVVELFSVPIDGSLPAIKLNAPLLSGSVQVRPTLTALGGRVVHAADEDADGRLELHATRVDGSSPSVRLGPPPGSGRVVQSVLVQPQALQKAHGAIAGRSVYYLADQETPGVFEVFRTDLEGLEPPVKVNAPLVAGGNVTGIVVVDPGRVLYRADQEVDELFQLYLAELPVTPVSGKARPAVAPTRSTTGGPDGLR